MAQYVTGALGEPSWHQLSRALDAGKATLQERQALAAFFDDAARETGAGALELPEPDEVDSLLAAMRQA